MAPQTKSDLAPNINVAEIEKLWLNPPTMHICMEEKNRKKKGRKMKLFVIGIYIFQPV